MRADRLLSILILLQSRGLLSAQELAAELEVSERTIYRDMNALSIAGFPVYANTGKGGGFGLLDGYSPELSEFTTRDIQALSTLNVPHSLDEIGLGDSLRHALLKLLASTGHGPGSDDNWMRQRFLMDHPTPKNVTQGNTLLPLLQKAVWEDRFICCRFQFLTHTGFSEPVRIAPYTLIASDQRWYIIGARRDFLRVYPMEMVIEASLLDETFSRPADYSPEITWQHWRAAQQSLLKGYKVTALVRDDLLDWISRMKRWPINGLQTEDETPGWSLVEIAFDHFSEARTQLLGFGNSVKIVSPEALRLSAIDYAKEFLTENEK
ncbi:MAG: WYL domain-containing protein [Anaerolineaceae bacterium]|nr:WYL domain-containing protein [Anaerolineaceae bacterium]